MPERSAVVTRLFGVGLAAALAAITVTLAVTGRIGLYINPESAWFAVGMSVLGLIGAVASFALPLGAEADHGHDHGDAPVGADAAAAAGAGAGAAAAAAAAAAPGFGAPASRRGAKFTPHSGAATPNPMPAPTHAPVAAHTPEHTHEHTPMHAHGHAPAHGPRPAAPRVRLAVGAVAASAGGVIATGLVAVALVTPPATLSAELAMSRDTGTPPLFQGADTVALATTGDTASFGVGEWASVFATATNPEAFEGDEISLTGFVTPSSAGGFGLTRLIITHCVIDAQPASVPVGEISDVPATGEWVTVTGVIRDRDGSLVVEATGVETVAEPEDPYEY
ncbi:TIGR03943 family putative permease subunit [Microbacterium oleivorans]|uniref:DUF1980 domain-containing protein n=1 Tax=Microbacterium oleivorans TaxID=273677 RepID=A0A7D5IY29_9MICO|nr:DUF1980 domain-containing protein [Microbacterium oleivorans]QLD12036.1 DUF1980 domain-containing protein [Microbacterium oleivorans]